MRGPKTCWLLYLTSQKLATEPLTPQKLIFKPLSFSENPWRLKRGCDLEGKEPHILPSTLELKGTLGIVSQKPLISHLRSSRAVKSNNPAEKSLVAQPGILLLDHTPPVSFSLGAGDSCITYGWCSGEICIQVLLPSTEERDFSTGIWFFFQHLGPLLSLALL